MKLLYRLLRRNVSTPQLIGFSLVNLLGGLVVLLGIQGYRDFCSFAEGAENILSKGNVVITKPVTTVQTIGSMLGLNRNFSEREIDELRALPAVSAVGEFVAAQFEVKASLSIGGSRMSSEIFLEAVSDEFILGEYKSVGTAMNEWSAGLESKKIPIVLPRNYINLYNFGFATANGMPQISDDLLGAFTIRLYFDTPKGVVSYDAVVCGLTSKINTILVPWDFMMAVNSEYAPGKEPEVSRLILSTNAKDAGDSLLQYLNEKGFLIEGDSSLVRLQSLVYGVIFVVIGVGALFSLLAFLLLAVGIQLIVEKNKETIHNLYSMGYPVSRIASVYLCMVFMADGVVWLLAAVTATVVYPMFAQLMANVSPDFAPASMSIVWMMATLLALLFMMMHGAVIYMNVKRKCRKM